MTIYKFTANLHNSSLTKLTETHFEREGILETKEIHSSLEGDINILVRDTDDKLFVLSREYNGWFDSQRSIDFLCVDQEANLVVIEIKRTQDGGHMDLQALRYAAMVSPMKFIEAVEALSEYKNIDQVEAEGMLLGFLKRELPDEDSFGNTVRIILASADFSKEVTTTAMWLNDMGIDVRCVRMLPYKYNGEILVDIQQLVPVPEASDYQIQIGQKRRAERAEKSERSRYSNLCPTLNENQIHEKLDLIFNRESKLVKPLLVFIQHLLKANSPCSRDEIKKVLVEAGESNDVGRAGNLLSNISSALTNPSYDVLRAIITWKDLGLPQSGTPKDDYQIRPEFEYRELIQKIIDKHLAAHQG